MDERVDQAGILLAIVAGILEDASALAASADTVRDPAGLDAIQRALVDAGTLMAAVRVLVRDAALAA
ncbi:hypothetical protein H7F51_14630 [Novosphingobium flavum]|uniref:Uncharacterized protein n=1 Tax=Novosphingobium flavum TaxID=1778672 RepID=A0A7X1FTN1_9SPHN|nr:hypothetical protein [Novosphingobium flavum]MBC2666753.1 hypothetical protein [Novosphingobium flavum]